MLTPPFSGIQLLHLVVKIWNYSKHKLRPIGAGILLPHVHAADSFSEGRTTERAVNNRVDKIDLNMKKFIKKQRLSVGADSVSMIYRINSIVRYIAIIRGRKWGLWRGKSPYMRNACALW